jgi:2-polyprenyl-3-methyl-5-hydroxy-6-metoxy-1,4-benzoquinol methylase
MSRYLAAIDELVVVHAKNSKYILDIGCGDGVRGQRLAEKIKPKKFMMVDSSVKMVELANRFRSDVIEVKKMDIADDNLNDKLQSNHFDAILCLWNVFGHITNLQERSRALLNIRKVLRENGVLLIDVSNRYNVAYYGIKSVLKNMLKDLFHPNDDNGNFSYTIDVGKEKIPSYCHFFTPSEFPHLCQEARLQIERKIYVNYTTGAITNLFGGHVFYVVKKKTLPRPPNAKSG